MTRGKRRRSTSAQNKDKNRKNNPAPNANGNGHGRVPKGAVSAKEAKANASAGSKHPAKPKPIPRGLGANLYPPLLRSFGTAALAVTQPVIILSTLAFVFIVWLLVLALGVRAFPPEMLHLFGLPPFAAQFDGSVATTVFGSQTGLLVALLLTVIRAGFFSVVVGIIDESIEFGRVSLVGPLRGLRAFPAVLAAEYVALVATFFGGSLGAVLGQAASQILFLLVPIAIVFFLAMPIITAVVGGFGIRESIRRGVQAGRLPGWPRYLLLCVTYYLFFQIMPQLLIGQVSVVTANPSFGTWVTVLFGAFLHLTFIGVFIQMYRAAAPYLPLIPRPRQSGAVRSKSRSKR